MRKNFYENTINIQREFERIRSLFKKQKYDFRTYEGTKSIFDFVKLHFNSFPKSITGSSDDFDVYNRTKGYDKYDNDIFIDIKDLIHYCEYVKTFISVTDKIIEGIINCTGQSSEPRYKIKELISIIDSTMNDLDLMPMKKDDSQIFIPKNPAVVSASEIASEEIVTLILEYNYYSLKDDIYLNNKIDKKRTILLKLADELEPQRKDLKSINSTLEDNLFYLFNNINIRHNNTNPNDKSKYKAYVANLSQNELEKWYDETYQLCLLAFLELKNVERNNKIKQLKQDILNTK